LIPYENDSLKIASISGKKGKVKPMSNVSVQFDPFEIPRIDTEARFLFPKEQFLLKSNNAFPQFVLNKKVEQLDEVVVTEEIRDIELEKLQALSHGSVKALTDRDRRVYGNIFNYIGNNGFKVVQTNLGEYQIINRIPTGGNPIPSVYLDGVFLNPPNDRNDSSIAGFQILISLNLNDVAYVDFNKYGLGEGLRGGGGAIRIYTKSDYSSNRNFRPVYSSYDFPLRFTNQREFYTPKYASYSNAFYERYGVIEWFPNIRPDVYGKLVFKVPDTDQEEVQLLIEGITGNGKFISEKIIMSLEK